jgi:hypothetical protein
MSVLRLLSWLGLMALIGSTLLVAAEPAKPKGKSDAKKGYDDVPAPVGPAVRANPAGFKIHDLDRAAPPVVTPGAQPGAAPSDAIILFDGKDLSKWQSKEMKEVDDKKTGKKKKVATDKNIDAQWKVENGYVQCVPGSGDIFTRDALGDCQLHLEFATPAKVEGDSQGRGNSGVFFLSTYELQILDAYNNPSYSDGITGAVYGQYPPYVNVCKPPGEWQTYDVIFRGPRFDEQGNVTRKARMTVFLNGVVVQDNSELVGPTSHKRRAPYTPHADKAPLKIQDHHNDTRYRNIWVRPLPDDATYAK